MASTMAAVAPFGATSSVAVMLLIDNSGLAQIATAWSDLRDQWLPSLVVRLASAYPSASITTFVQESCSSSNQDVNGEGWSQPRKYYTFNDALLDVRFSTSSPNYGLSASLIQRTVQFLSYTTSMARHIIIVGSSLSSMDPTSNWSRLTQSLVEGTIYCHLLLPAIASGPTEPLSRVFDETLRRQNLVEDSRWLLTDRTKIVPRLSAVRNAAPQVVAPLEVTPPALHPRTMSAPIERDLPPVSNQSMHANTSAPPPDDEFPNLVTQLQQMHGLTKKKVYGTKPKRRPFVSAEVFREHPRKSSSLSPVSPSDTNHGGRVTSPSVLDRAGRVYHQGGSVLQQPSAAAVPRALMDISGTSSLASASNMSPEANAATPGSSYHSPTSAIPIPPAPNPPSPILNHAPPFWDPSVPLPSRATVTYQQPPPSIPISSALNLHPGGSRLHQAYPTGPNPSAGIKLPETAGIPALTTSSRRDGGVVPPLFGSANALDNRRLSGYPGKNENQASPPPPMNVTVSASSNAANLNYSIPPAPHRRSVSGPVFRGGESSGLSLSSSAHSEQGRSSLAGPSSTMTMTVSPDQQQPSRRRFTHAPSLSEGSSSSSYPPTQNPYPVVPPLPPPASTPWHNNSDNNAFVDSPISSYTSSPTSPLTTTTSTTTAPMTTLSPYGMTMTLTTGGHVQPASSHYEYDSSASVPAAASSYPSSPISSSTSSLTGWAG